MLIIRLRTLSWLSFNVNILWHCIVLVHLWLKWPWYELRKCKLIVLSCVSFVIHRISLILRKKKHDLSSLEMHQWLSFNFSYLNKKSFSDNLKPDLAQVFWILGHKCCSYLFGFLSFYDLSVTDESYEDEISIWRIKL